MGSLLLSSGSWYTQFCLCCPRLESVSPLVLWKACNQPAGPQARLPRDSPSLCRSPGWEAWCGVQNLHDSARTSSYYCSPVCGSPTQWVWDFILSWWCPSYCLAVASSLSLDMEYHFLVGSRVLSMVVQQLATVLVLLQEDMSACPSTPLSWTGNPNVFLR